MMPLQSEDPLCVPIVAVPLMSMLKGQSFISDLKILRQNAVTDEYINKQNLSQSDNIRRLAGSAGGSSTVSKPGTPVGGTTNASQGRLTQQLSCGGNQCLHITGAMGQAAGEDTLQVHPQESFYSD